MSENLNRLTDYLEALEAMVIGKELAKFFHPDVTQVEYPNQLATQGATRDLAAILEGAERGKEILNGQTYQVNNTIDCGDTIIAEIKWTGKLNMPIGKKRPGDEMVAHFAVFVEFRDGLIWHQRNYDCFEPF